MLDLQVFIKEEKVTVDKSENNSYLMDIVNRTFSNCESLESMKFKEHNQF